MSSCTGCVAPMKWRDMKLWIMLKIDGHTVLWEARGLAKTTFHLWHTTFTYSIFCLQFNTLGENFLIRKATSNRLREMAFDLFLHIRACTFHIFVDWEAPFGSGRQRDFGTPWMFIATFKIGDRSLVNVVLGHFFVFSLHNWRRGSGCRWSYLDFYLPLLVVFITDIVIYCLRCPWLQQLNDLRRISTAWCSRFLHN